MNRASQDRWTTYYDAHGHVVERVFDPERRMFGPDADTYIFRLVGKVSQRGAQDLLDAYHGLAGLGLAPKLLHQAIELVCLDWEHTADGQPREEPRVILDRLAKV